MQITCRPHSSDGLTLFSISDNSMKGDYYPGLLEVFTKIIERFCAHPQVVSYVVTEDPPCWFENEARGSWRLTANNKSYVYVSPPLPAGVPRASVLQEWQFQIGLLYLIRIPVDDFQRSDDAIDWITQARKGVGRGEVLWCDSDGIQLGWGGMTQEELILICQEITEMSFEVDFGT